MTLLEECQANVKALEEAHLALEAAAGEMLSAYWAEEGRSFVAAPDRQQKAMEDISLALVTLTACRKALGSPPPASETAQALRQHVDRVVAWVGRLHTEPASSGGGDEDMTNAEGFPYACANCGASYEDMGDMNYISDLHERVAPGEIMPAGECPACGCLCHPTTE